jgi:uncharacterized membrane protein YeaQ/YmgE (transglycosylase-associated protein family)
MPFLIILPEVIIGRYATSYIIAVKQSLTRAGAGHRPFMGIIAWLIVGLIAGLLARWAVPGEGPGGVIGDITVGIVGAFIGGWIFNAFGHTGVTGINLYSIVVAFIGGVVLLLILRAFTRPRRAY